MNLYSTDLGTMGLAIFRLSGTSLVALLAPVSGGGYTVLGGNFCNESGSAVLATLTLFDGTNHHRLIDEKSIAANDYLIYEFGFKIPPTWSLWAQASVTNVLTVAVTHTIFTRSGA